MNSLIINYVVLQFVHSKTYILQHVDKYLIFSILNKCISPLYFINFAISFAHTLYPFSVKWM